MTIKLPLAQQNYLWIPAKKGLGKSSPYVMVVLHGRGDSIDSFRTFPQELGLEHCHYLLLNAPNPYEDGFSWYDFEPNQWLGIQHSRKLLTKVFNALFEQGYKPENCFMLGYSQGCLMTLEFGGRYRHTLGGYVGISGYCFDSHLLSQEVRPSNKKAPWLITHGIYDDALPVTRTRRQMRHLQREGFNLVYREYKKGHIIHGGWELTFIRNWLLAQMKLK